MKALAFPAAMFAACVFLVVGGIVRDEPVFWPLIYGAIGIVYWTDLCWQLGKEHR